MNKNNRFNQAIVAFVEMWNTHDTLNIKNIRPGKLAYFLALPVVFALVNMQNNYLISSVGLFGFDSLTIMYIIYSLGVIVMMALKYDYCDRVSKIAAAVSMISMTVHFFITDPRLSFMVLLISWLSVGICAAYAMIVYVFVNNNTERLIGICLAAISHGVFMILLGSNIDTWFLRVGLPLILSGILVLSIFGIRKEEVTKADNQNGDPAFPGIKLFFAFFLCICIIDSLSSFVFTRDGFAFLVLNGLGIFAAVGSALIIQLIFQQSVWHMWNLFFVLAVTAHVLVLLPGFTYQEVAGFIHGAIYIGYVSVFYTMGGVNKRHNTIRGYKRNLLIHFCLMVPILGALGWMEGNWPQEVTVGVMIGAASLMVLFFLLGPVFQRYFFTPEWIREYQEIDMSPAGLYLAELDTSGQPLPSDIFDDFIERTAKLTRTEKELFRCYYDGKSTQEILAAMFISLNTLKTHNAHIFDKLAINSRDELLLYINLIRKSGKASTIEF